jgi:hypothetical protein
MKVSDCFKAGLRYGVIALGLCAAVSPAAAQWSRIAAVPAGDVIAVVTQGDTIVAGTLTRAYVSTDAGASWRPTAQIGGTVPIQAVLVRNGTLYAGTNGLGVFTSADLGLTWHAFNDGLVGGLFNSQLDVSDLEVLGDNLYAGTFGAGVYVRNLAAAGMWQHFGEEFEPNQASNIRSLAVGGTRLLADAGANGSVFHRDPDDPEWTISWLGNVGLRPGLEAFSTVWTGTGWVVATGVGRGVFTSAQGQEPWTFVNLGLGLLNSGTVTTRGHRVFGAFNRDLDAVIEHSGDDGATWEVLDVLPNVLVFQMATHGTDLYAGRADGLWVRSTATVSVPQAGSGAGLRFALTGPQPVVGVVRVRFELPEAGRAEIEVFDVSGRRVSQPVRESLSAGAHEVSWNAGDLRPGIYQARLTAAERHETVRLVRVR